MSKLRMKIRCAVCDKIVDETTIWDEDSTMSRKIVVKCHGAKDEMSIGPFDVARMDRKMAEGIMDGSIEGVAFASPGVLAGPALLIGAPPLKLPSPADA